MTLDKMLRLVRVLSNSCFVRWWAHWNYPNTHPWKIAFAAVNWDATNVEFETTGMDVPFTIEKYGTIDVYVFERLDENGKPFRV